jgi:hypothetical protein
MSRGRFAVLCVLALLALGATLVATRYTVVIGGSDRYYSTLRLDRWTGEVWRMDYGGREWTRVRAPGD